MALSGREDPRRVGILRRGHGSQPALLLCLSFGGVSFLEVLLCSILLFIYVHVLVIATLAASTLVSEIMALPLVIGAFLASAALGLAPLGPHPLSLTPHRRSWGCSIKSSSELWACLGGACWEVFED
ncbi:MAG: hypothetical protein ACI957_005538 [Verrucomicrobiales bacterium]|jgi:hypothetical protein